MGISADADFHYLFSRFWGIGLRYSLFTSSVKMDYTILDATSDIPIYCNVNEREKFYLNYLGPSILFQQWLGKNHKFKLNEIVSFGYMLFRDEKQFDPYQYVFVNPETNAKQYNILKEGNTFSGTFQLSLEYYPVSWLSFGANGGVFYSVFRSLEVSDNDSKKTDKSITLDLSRVDYSIGIRFHF
jgi:hypothetical protein